MLILLCTLRGSFDVTVLELSNCDRDAAACKTSSIHYLALCKKCLLTPVVDKRYPKLQTEGIQGMAGSKEIPQFHEDAKSTQVFNEYLRAFLAENTEGSTLPKNNAMLYERTVFIIGLAHYWL